MEKPGVLNKTIPTILGIIILIGGVAAGIYLVRKEGLLETKAGPETIPKDITISNVSSDRFTVSWITEVPTTGSVKWGETEKLDKIVDDYRDSLSGETKSYTSHYVNVENLKPDQKYFFKIQTISGRTKKLYDNQGHPFQVTTGPTLGTQPSTDIIYGQVISADKKPAEGTILYISLANAAPISTLVSKDGMWAKPLHTVRTIDLSSYTSYDAESSILTIKSSLGVEKNNNATTIITTKNDTPVPTITLGEDKDYRAEQELPAPSPEMPSTIMPQEPTETPSFASPSASPTMPESYFSSAADSDESTPSSELLITNPAEDGEEVNTVRPQILGKGLPEKVLTIKIESSQTYTGTVVVDDEGNWEFTPPADLTPGEHQVTATFVDENGQERSVTRQFVVLAAGESQLPSFESSPSASITPSVPPRVSMPSTEGGVPASGVIGPTFIVFLSGLFFLFAGFWLQFFRRYTPPR